METKSWKFRRLRSCKNFWRKRKCHWISRTFWCIHIKLSSWYIEFMYIQIWAWSEKWRERFRGCGIETQNETSESMLLHIRVFVCVFVCVCVTYYEDNEDKRQKRKLLLWSEGEGRDLLKRESNFIVGERDWGRKKKYWSKKVFPHGNKTYITALSFRFENLKVVCERGGRERRESWLEKKLTDNVKRE